MYPSSPDICCRDSTMGQAQPVLQPSNTQCQPLASCVPSSQAPHGHSIQPGQSRQPGTSQQHCIFSQENTQGPAGKDNHRAMCLPTVASSGTSHGKTPIRKAVRGKKWCRRTPKKQGYFSHSSLCEGEAHLHTWFKFHSADSFPCSKTQQRTDVLLPHITKVLHCLTLSCVFPLLMWAVQPLGQLCWRPSAGIIPRKELWRAQHLLVTQQQSAALTVQSPTAVVQRRSN